jgi:RHS repeat-associated protein
VTYDAFGNSSSLSGSGTLGAIQFQGMRWDAATSQYIARYRVYNPATGQWNTVDPLSFAAGDANTRRAVGNDTTNTTDPSGLWAVQRKFVRGRPNPKQVEAIAGEKDTVAKLAQNEGYNPEEFKKWLSLPEGVGKIKLADGSEKDLSELQASSEIQKGQKVLIPNTILFLWIGDLTFHGGMLAVSWRTDQDWLTELGYNVTATQDIAEQNGKIKQVCDAKVILKLVHNWAQQKQLAGIVVSGHGNEAGIGNKGGLLGPIRPGVDISISYKEIKQNVGYGLSWVILNVCLGGFKKGDTIAKQNMLDQNLKLGVEGGKDLSSDMTGSRFGGITRTLFPVIDTIHPKGLKPKR